MPRNPDEPTDDDLRVGFENYERAVRTRRTVDDLTDDELVDITRRNVLGTHPERIGRELDLHPHTVRAALERFRQRQVERLRVTPADVAAARRRIDQRKEAPPATDGHFFHHSHSEADHD
ncbi:MAG TPA: hypothetical protein VL132_05070 [Planctomycetaceae bacterium]|nr:hypothetical protein [Planctomycetaceae bacterium]